MSEASATFVHMMDLQAIVETLSSPVLLSATHELVKTSRSVEVELLIHLGEIDARKLYLDQASGSMFTFCVREYGFSEDAAYNRITVARAARAMPGILEALQSGRVHMTGLRLLTPHLTAENHANVLTEAAGKTTGQIKELVARLDPKPDAATVIRRVSNPANPALDEPPAPSVVDREVKSLPEQPALLALATPIHAFPCEERRSMISPLRLQTFKFQFTASGTCRDKLREAQDLLRHRIPDGDVGTVVEKALEVLIDQLKKERFGQCRKPRKEAPRTSSPSGSRHIPDAVKRAVFERDGGRCTFTDEHGRRCSETGALEFDHRDGFARTRRHEIDGIRLLCRAHNQHAADEMYGRTFMQRARARGDPRRALSEVRLE